MKDHTIEFLFLTILFLVGHCVYSNGTHNVTLPVSVSIKQLNLVNIKFIINDDV